jgi:type I restriction enzyme S subunit
MGELKPGWKRVKFGEVVRLNKETCKDPEAAGINRVIGLEHLEPGDLRVRSWADVADGTTFSNRVRPGQVLFGKRRAYQRKVAVADFDAICSGDIYVFETTDQAQLMQELLPYICQTDSFFEYAVGTSAGSLSPRTNWTSLAAYEFVLPPLEEQQRIAEFLSVRERSRDAYLQASIAAEEVARAFVRDYFASFAGKFWTGAELSTLITKGESPNWQGFTYHEAGIRFITSENILDREIDLDPAKFISQEFHQKLSRSQICAGDVLVNIVGASIGRAAVVPDEIGEANTNQAVAVIRPRRELIEPKFMLEWFLSPFGQRIVAGQQVNTARANISLSDLRGMHIPCPGKAEQERLLGIVDELRTGARACRIKEGDVYRLNSRIL